MRQTAQGSLNSLTSGGQGLAEYVLDVGSISSKRGILVGGIIPILMIDRQIEHYNHLNVVSNKSLSHGSLAPRDIPFTISEVPMQLASSLFIKPTDYEEPGNTFIKKLIDSYGWDSIFNSIEKSLLETLRDTGHVIYWKLFKTKLPPFGGIHLLKHPHELNEFFAPFFTSMKTNAGVLPNVVLSPISLVGTENSLIQPYTFIVVSSYQCEDSNEMTNPLRKWKMFSDFVPVSKGLYPEIYDFDLDNSVQMPREIEEFRKLVSDKPTEFDQQSEYYAAFRAVVQSIEAQIAEVSSDSEAKKWTAKQMNNYTAFFNGEEHAYLLLRPRLFLETASIILMHQDKENPSSAIVVDRRSKIIGEDAKTKTEQLLLRRFFGTAVYQEERIMTLQDVAFCGYGGGGNTKFQTSSFTQFLKKEPNEFELRRFRNSSWLYFPIEFPVNPNISSLDFGGIEYARHPCNYTKVLGVDYSIVSDNSWKVVQSKWDQRMFIKGSKLVYDGMKLTFPEACCNSLQNLVQRNLELMAQVLLDENPLGNKKRRTLVDDEKSQERKERKLNQEKQIQESETKISELESEMRLLEKQNAERENELQRQNLELQSIIQKLEKKSDNTNEKKEVEKLRKKIQEGEEEKKKTEEKLERIEEKLNSEINQKKEEIDTALQSVNQTQQKLQTLNKEIVTKENEIAKLRAETEKHPEKLSQLNEQIRDLQAQITTLKELIEEYSKKKESLDKIVTLVLPFLNRLVDDAVQWSKAWKLNPNIVTELETKFLNALKTLTNGKYFAEWDNMRKIIGETKKSRQYPKINQVYTWWAELLFVTFIGWYEINPLQWNVFKMQYDNVEKYESIVSQVPADLKKTLSLYPLNQTKKNKGTIVAMAIENTKKAFEFFGIARNKLNNNIAQNGPQKKNWIRVACYSDVEELHIVKEMNYLFFGYQSVGKIDPFVEKIKKEKFFADYASTSLRVMQKGADTLSSIANCWKDFSEPFLFVAKTIENTKVEVETSQMLAARKNAIALDVYLQQIEKDINEVFQQISFALQYADIFKWPTDEVSKVQKLVSEKATELVNEISSTRATHAKAMRYHFDLAGMLSETID